MKTFDDFIVEDLVPKIKGKQLTHLVHLEDLPIHFNHAGVEMAGNMLEHTHKTLLGKASKVTLSTKYDGSPSVIFGNHPKNGQFFVATKSVFNKTPKINFSEDDIAKNHPEAPGLQKKLKAALQHLPKIMPSHGGVYQGDMMYTRGEAKKENGHYHVTPNTITYHAPEDSAHGQKIRHAQMGFVVHTMYSGKGDIHNMDALPLDKRERNKFKDHPDVHNIDPTLEVKPTHYTPEEQKRFFTHMENAKAAYKKMDPDALDIVGKHAENVQRHINMKVKKGGKPSTDEYIKFLTSTHKKGIKDMKMQKALDNRNAKHAADVQHVMENKKHFDHLFDVHSHLQKAKDVLTGVMAKNSHFGHKIGKDKTGPEGVVAVDNKGNMTKFVNRKEFSKQNMLKSKYRDTTP